MLVSVNGTEEELRITDQTLYDSFQPINIQSCLTIRAKAKPVK